MAVLGARRRDRGQGNIPYKSKRQHADKVCDLATLQGDFTIFLLRRGEEVILREVGRCQVMQHNQ